MIKYMSKMLDAKEFIKQYRKLYFELPQVSHWTRASVNCDYGDICVVSKDSYMCFTCSNMENCFNCHDSRIDRFCADLTFCENCELCYESVDCETCYNSDYLQDCKDCTDCQFCNYCIGCKNCFLCADLTRKNYCIMNKEYGAIEYFKKVRELKAQGVLNMWKKFTEVQEKEPKVFMHQTDNVNCFGDYLHHSKNCYFCFDSYLCEDSYYIFNANLERGTKDSLDCGPVANTFERCFDCAYAGYLFDCHHIYWGDWLYDCDWCTNLWESNHCFGCNYMKNKEYQILDKPVSKDEYVEITKRLNKELYKMGVIDLYGLLYEF